MTDLNNALDVLTTLLERLSIRYVVMGGLAVRVYGIPRPTQDIDLTIALPRERLPEFFQAVEALGYSVPKPYETGWLDQVAGMPLIKLRRYLNDRGLDVDLFLAESTFQEELLQRRRRIEAEGREIWIISPEDLILLKLIAGRQRDLADIADVLFTQGQLDLVYLRKWAQELGILKQLELALAEQPGAE